MLKNQDVAERCHFTYADGRRCTLPQFPDDYGLCFHHNIKYKEHLRSQEAGRQISLFLKTDILTACDLSCTLSALFSATAQGFIKPKTAKALGYLAQLMLQTQTLAKQEFLEAYDQPWSDVVSEGPAFNDPDAPTEPSTPAEPQDAAPAEQNTVDTSSETIPPPADENENADEASDSDEPAVPQDQDDPDPNCDEPAGVSTDPNLLCTAATPSPSHSFATPPASPPTSARELKSALRAKYR